MTTPETEGPATRPFDPLDDGDRCAAVLELLRDQGRLVELAERCGVGPSELERWRFLFLGAGRKALAADAAEQSEAEAEGREVSPRSTRSRIVRSFVYHVFLPTPPKLVFFFVCFAVYYFLPLPISRVPRLVWAAATTFTFLVLRWIDRRFHGHFGLEAAAVGAILAILLGVGLLVLRGAPLRISIAYQGATAVAVLAGLGARVIGRHLSP